MARRIVWTMSMIAGLVSACSAGQDVALSGVPGGGGASGGVPEGGLGMLDTSQGNDHEVCGNGMDDNGDGQIDEGCFCGTGQTQSCYRGPWPTRNVGACKDGAQSCVVRSTGEVHDGHWGDCTGDTLPGTESCNGLDDDCNGSVDDGCACSSGATRSCGTEWTAPPCHPGTQTCSQDGTWGGCDGASAPEPEKCGDGKDNDCNGTVDDGCGCVPEPEVCGDGKDNDCDGTIDNGCNGHVIDGDAGCADWHTLTLKCEWKDLETTNTPVVVDLDGDGKPEIVARVATQVQGTPVNKLVAVRGTDCSLLWLVDSVQGMNPAVGDLDGDGKPEIVLGSMLSVYGHDGSLIDQLVAGGDVPAIADLDGVPPAEIVVGPGAYRLTGSPPKLTQLWSANPPNPMFPYDMIALVADVDLDGKPEVITRNHFYDGITGADKTPAAIAALPVGWAALAQFDSKTPRPELVLSSYIPGNPFEVRVVDTASGNVLFSSHGAPAKLEWTGAPVVADFDGDGQPEFAVMNESAVWMYDEECAATPLPAKCAAPGLLWKSSSQDLSSGYTNGVAFDFNGDGAAELVYRDECWLRMYDGKTGKVLGVAVSSSGTNNEEAVIADVDADGHAEIIVTSNVYPGCTDDSHTGTKWTGSRTGIQVYGNPCWAPARKVWNQHTYHVTNVGEDGSIPTKEANSWDVHNGYRMQVGP